MASAEAHCDLAIAGAGLVGASLALLCRRARPDWRIALIDPADPTPGDYHPSFDARSTALSAGSIGIFERLGLWPAIARHATVIDRVHVSDRGYLPGQRLDGEGEALGAVVPNAWLGKVLNDALADQPIERVRDAVTGFTPRAGAGALQLDKAEPLIARLCVAADGARSRLRESAGIDVEHRPYRHSALIANVQFARPHKGVAFERFTDSGPLALLPLDGPRGRRAALVWTHADAARLARLPEPEFLRRLQERFGHRVGRFEKVGRRDVYPLALTLAREPVRSNLVLVGNAAHSLHPVAGQGFNLSLRDLVALTDELDRAPETLGALAPLLRYSAARERDQRLTTHIGQLMLSLFGRDHAAAITARHLGLLSLELAPPLKNAFRRQMMGLAGPIFGGARG